MPESRSAQEVSALWLFLRGRLAKLHGGTDARWAQKPRADFSTAVLTPETPGLSAAAMSEDEEDWENELPAWASAAVANASNVDRRAPAPRTAAPQIQRAPGGVMTAPPPDRVTQLDRRKSDRGPPAGQVDRRQPRSFGRRPTH
jgi:hypothetical protein